MTEIGAQLFQSTLAMAGVFSVDLSLALFTLVIPHCR
jgi:hypothetical protein